MRDEQGRYDAKGLQALGVNPAALESHERYAARFAFAFPLLSDPGGAVALAYGAMRAGSRLVLRTVYVIGRDGRVAFAARGAPSTDEILAAVP